MTFETTSDGMLTKILDSNLSDETKIELTKLVLSHRKKTSQVNTKQAKFFDGQTYLDSLGWYYRVKGSLFGPFSTEEKAREEYELMYTRVITLSQ